MDHRARLKLTSIPKGSIQIKKCPKKWIKSKRGGGLSAKNQKVHNSKFGLFDKRGGVRIFKFFSNVNVDLFLFLGGVLIFKVFLISNFSQIRSRGGGAPNSNFSQIQKSPNYPRGGGG